MNASHRIYLEKTAQGLMRQTERITGFFYDVDTSRYVDAGGARWYLVASARACPMLNRRGRDIDSPVILTEVGAHLRRQGANWYVQAEDLDLYAAQPPHRRLRLRAAWLSGAAFKLMGALIAFCLLVTARDLRFGTGLDLRPGAVVLAALLTAVLLVQYALIKLKS